MGRRISAVPYGLTESHPSVEPGMQCFPDESQRQFGCRGSRTANGFDDLQAFVHQGGRINADLAPIFHLGGLRLFIVTRSKEPR